MNRAERRREQRKTEKFAWRVVRERPGVQFDDAKLRIGLLQARLDTIYQEDLRRLMDYTGEAMEQELFEAECYMQFGMLIIALQAIHMTFGNLKTVQKGLDKFVRNLTPAMEYVDSRGINQAFRDLQDIYGLSDLEAEDFDINSLWEHDQKIRHIVLRVWESRKPEFEKLIKEAQEYGMQC